MYEYRNEKSNSRRTSSISLCSDCAAFRRSRGMYVYEFEQPEILEVIRFGHILWIYGNLMEEFLQVDLGEDRLIF